MVQVSKYFRSRFFVGKPTHTYGKSETIQGDNMTIRDIIRDFTLNVQRDEFENRDFFYDFDIRSFSDDSGNVNVDALVSSLDRYVPLRELDIKVANHEQLLEFYTNYVNEAKAYFAEKEAKLKEKESLETPESTSATTTSIEQKLEQITK